ncbi:hypothetical protein AB9P05_23745 [Roseivirga sp. BDSF3-8]|uniref:hypothetical protein n=1 Tax=Roseivirga sp. BDSF3-8 TaxID=3241598 RepID=UPI0035326F8E
MKSRAAGIILLMCLILPGMCTCLWLQHRKAVVRKEVKRMLMHGVDKEQLVSLTFSHQEAKQQLRWKHAREFAYQGQMYDVVDSVVQGDSVTYWCWWDSEETELEQQLTTLARKAFGQDHNQRHRQQQLLDFYFSLYHTIPAQWQAGAWSSDVKSNLPYLRTYCQINQPPPVPPPRMA